MPKQLQIQAANETQVANEGDFVAGVAFVNQYSSKSKDNWVQLSPFGKFPNVVGTQVFDPSDAQAICNEFDSVPSVGVKAIGLPWYVGHPDHPAFKEQYKDTAAKGRIKELECRHDASCKACQDFANEASSVPCKEHGLFGNVRWNDEGKALIANEAFHGHSTNWRMRKNGAGEFHPFSLKSVGFTNEPGIPVPAITTANEKKESMSAKNDNQTGTAKKPTLLDHIAKLLGKPEIAKEGANEDDAVAAMEGYAANQAELKKNLDELTAKHATLTNAHQVLSTAHDAVVKKYGCANEGALPEATGTVLTTCGFALPETDALPAMANEISTQRAAVKAKDAELQAANQKVTDLTAQAANERKERDGQMLDMLVVGGFATKVERDQYATDLAANEKRDATLVAIKALKPKINVVTGLSGLGHVSTAVNEQTAKQVGRIDAIVEAVNQYQDEQQKKTGKRPDQMKAHAHIQKTRPDLFTADEKNITR